MRENSEALLEMVRKAQDKHPDDIDAAVNQAFVEWQSHPEYPEFVATMVRDAIRNLVYSCRGRINREIKANKEPVVPEPKVGLATGAVNRVVTRCLLDSYSIAGRSLGSIMGSELLGIAKTERNRANGHAFNARLCERLAGMVDKDKSVRDCVKESKIKKIFKEIQGTGKNAASGPGAIADGDKINAAAPA